MNLNVIVHNELAPRSEFSFLTVEFAIAVRIHEVIKFQTENVAEFRKLQPFNLRVFIGTYTITLWKFTFRG